MKTYCCENRAVLKCNFFVQLSENEKTDCLFDEILNSVYNFLDNTLYPKICEEYHSCDSKEKRFRFGYFYSFEITRVFCNDAYLSIRIRINLKNRDRSYFKSYDRYFVFRRDDGSILPYEYFTGAGFRRKYRREGYENYYLKDNELIFLRSDSLESCFSLI